MSASSRQIARIAALLALTSCLVPASSYAGKKDKSAPQAAPSSAPGNLAVIDFKSYGLTTSGVERRVLLRALIENQAPQDFAGPWSLEFQRSKNHATIGTCQGEAIPQGRVAVCEVWVSGDAVREEEMLDATVVRSAAVSAFDRDPADDTRSMPLRVTPERGNILRISEWNLFPTILTGANEIKFKFAVEGSHLVWVMTPDAPAKLVAGHPADGLLSGKGAEKVKTSGPVTLVARNSLGAFVYATIPVVHPYAPTPKAWVEQKESPTASVGTGTAQVLDAGVYDVPEDKMILDYLATYLGAKNWAAEIERLRHQVEGEGDPVPASVLNPRTKKP